MNLLKLIALTLSFSFIAACSDDSSTASKAPAKTLSTQFLNKDALTKVLMKTSMGDIELGLDAELAPESVKNFLSYVESGYFSNTIFHRVIPDFMIQGGGFTAEYEKKDTQAAIQNEAFNGLKNEEYTLAMARTGAPHSATSQFFINTKNNGFLNHTRKSPNGWGYAVFGIVTKGQDVVDKIEAVKTGSGGIFSRDAPQELVVIQSMELIK